MIGRRRPDERASALGEQAPNLTPLLDVLFMLLFFLVLTANTAQYALELALPRTEESGPPAVAENQVTITLYRAGEAVTIDTVTVVGWARARAVLAARIAVQPDAWYLIAGDREVPLQKVVRVLGFLQSQRVERVKILVQQE